jgi:hypothetical protein
MLLASRPIGLAGQRTSSKRTSGWSEAREEGQGRVGAGLAALRAAAGRQAKEIGQDEIKERLLRIAARERGDEHAPAQGSRDIRGRLADVLGKAKAEDQERELDEERKRQRERDRESDWEL